MENLEETKKETKEEAEEKEERKEEVVKEKRDAEQSPEIPKTMQAVVYNKFGDSDVLEFITDFPVPVCPAGQVLVKVYASGLNPVDWKMRSGLIPFLRNFPRIAGLDFSGVIVQKGASVSEYCVGDSVYGVADYLWGGACAQYLVCSLSKIAKKPKNLSHAEAASLPIIAATAWVALVECAKLLPGQKLLIIGASGGTGHFAVQLASRYLSAHVIGVCSTNNVQFVKDLGAAHVIDYSQSNWWEELAGQNIDMVYDCVGKPSSFERSTKVLDPKTGYYFSIVPGGTETHADNLISGFASSFFELGTKKLSQWFLGGTRYDMLVNNTGTNSKVFSAVAALIEQNKILPVVTKRFPLSQTKQGHEELEKGGIRGKSVVIIHDEP